MLVALGGNAILKEHQKGTAPEQFQNLRIALESLVDLLQEGHKVIITHGNGPQVGVQLHAAELAAPEVPPMPLDVLVAETQGQIGYMVQNTLANIFRRRQIKRKVFTVITQVIVDKDDPAFEEPTKGVGRFYTREQAHSMMSRKGVVMRPDAGRGWRRMVPSPEPIDVVEVDFIKDAYQRGDVVIACGGGGIPVLFSGGQYVGVEAVVDKDRASAVLAARCGVELMLMLTDVQHVFLDYKAPTQRPIAFMTAEEAEAYMREGQFPAGSMGPKIEAALDFLERGGERVIITSLDSVKPALAGQTGTHIG